MAPVGHCQRLVLRGIRCTRSPELYFISWKDELSFLRQTAQCLGKAGLGSQLKCPWLQGQVECTETQETAGACVAVTWAPTWCKTHLKGVQHNEDIGPNDAQVDEDSTHPGEPQHRQQHQDRFGRGPGGRKSSGLPGHISEMKHYPDSSCGTNSSANKKS